MTKSNFQEYNLSKELLKSIQLLNYETPTQVQSQVIPVALERKDILVQSQTGSGKTAAFAIPICEMVDWVENKPQALILEPTRELAIQVKEDFFHIGRFKRLKVSALYGRDSISKQEKELKQKTHVAVGTPGRVMDHINRGTLITDEIKYLVIDEADEMLNMGFLEQVQAIIETMPKARVTMLFSATLGEDIVHLSKEYMIDPVTIEVVAQTLTVDSIEQWGYKVSESAKLDLLKSATIMENPDSCMVFCNTQEKVDMVCQELRKADYLCDKIHGGMEQDIRIKVMNNFKKGHFRYLVATDVAARGIDVDHVTHVINFDVPKLKENYVHRIGRTGRQGKSGKAITFFTERENHRLREIQSYAGVDIPIKTAPRKEEVADNKDAFEEKGKVRMKVKAEKGSKLNQGITKIHINAGKKTKMRPVDVVGTLCSIPGMTADDIGIIRVQDVSTYVEVLNNKGTMVLEELQTKTIKGRIRRVTKSTELF